jgi:hypothetical protein
MPPPTTSCAWGEPGRGRAALHERREGQHARRTLRRVRHVDRDQQHVRGQLPRADRPRRLRRHVRRPPRSDPGPLRPRHGPDDREQAARRPERPQRRPGRRLLRGRPVRRLLRQRPETRDARRSAGRVVPVLRHRRRVGDGTEAVVRQPEGADERTITGVNLYEFGPVTFPAYAQASAGLRSATDTFIDRFINDTLFFRRFLERTGPAVVEKIRAALPPTAEVAVTPDEPTAPTATAEAPTERGHHHVDDCRRQRDGGQPRRARRLGRPTRRQPPRTSHRPPPVPDEAAMAEADARRSWVQAHVRHLA